MLHIQCNTPVAVLFAAVPDDKGVLRCPSEDPVVPGLHIDAKPLHNINEQLIDRLNAVLDVKCAMDITIYQEYCDEFELPNGTMATLYIASLPHPKYKIDSKHKSIPEILREMPKDRRRLVFLKAWQVLTGGLKLDTDAVENADLSSIFGGS